MELSSVPKIFCGHVLSVFDPQAAVSGAMRFHEFCVEMRIMENSWSPIACVQI